MTTQFAPTGYTSSNLSKHTSANPAQRWLLGRFHATVAHVLREVRAERVLDAGCGEGFGMQAVLGERCGMVGIDYSVAALGLAQQLNPGAAVAVGDVTRLPFGPKQFDLVVCMEVLEHLPAPERGLAELRRVGRRWLLLSVPNEPLFRGANFLRGKHVRAWGNDPGHLNHWSSWAFLHFVARQCRVVRWQTSFPWTIVLCRTD